MSRKREVLVSRLSSSWSRRARLDCGRARGHDARAARSAGTPHARNKHRRIERVANGIVPRRVADVVELRLPVVAKFAAEC